MTEQEELKMLRDRCANLEKNYRDGWPKTVADARKEGHAQAAQEYEGIVGKLEGALRQAVNSAEDHDDAYDFKSGSAWTVEKICEWLEQYGENGEEVTATYEEIGKKIQRRFGGGK